MSQLAQLLVQMLQCCSLKVTLCKPALAARIGSECLPLLHVIGWLVMQAMQALTRCWKWSMSLCRLLTLAVSVATWASAGGIASTVPPVWHDFVKDYLTVWYSVMCPQAAAMTALPNAGHDKARKSL